MLYHIEPPTCILSNVHHHHIGVINNIDVDSIQVGFNMNSQQEMSFDVYKVVDGEVCSLWDEIVGLRYVYVPEHQEYYKIDVDMDEADNTIKHLTLTSASEYELSNRIIRSLEINTESDILRDKYDKDGKIPDYSPNVLYNPNDTANSILHRALADKAPDWSIKYVDPTIANIQRTFSVNNQKIYDFLTKTVAEEYDCLFQFDSVNREISVYDLLCYCNECGKRGEFTTKCNKCGSDDFTRGYGNDSHVLINYNNYSEKITVDGNETSVKNCFHVSAGDDKMNSAIRNSNPSGSQYIYKFSQADYHDVPSALVDKLNQYAEDYEATLPTYQAVAKDYYNAVNDYYYYKTSMMPRINGVHWDANTGYSVGDRVYVKTLPSWCYLECTMAGISGSEEFDATMIVNGQVIQDGTVQWTAHQNILPGASAEQILNDLTAMFTASTYVMYFESNLPQSVTEANNEVENLASLEINNLYRVEVVTDDVDTETVSNYISGDKWYGRLKVYNTGYPDDKAVSPVSIMTKMKIATNLEEYKQYMQNKVEKRLNKADTTFTEIYKTEDDDFDVLITQYGLDSLESFAKSYNGCLDTLRADRINDEDSEWNGILVYDPIYKPYLERLQKINTEIAKRQKTVDAADKKKKDLEEQMWEIQKPLQLKNYLGDILYATLYNYIREDSYQNSNYISTGLSDGEVINYANELLDAATEELNKACELQITLTDTVKNMFNTEEFANFKDKLEIGDYLLCEVQDELYRLRLISVSYSYSSPGNIDLKFSNFTKVSNFFSDAQDVINSAKSISLSYNGVVHQVAQNTNVANTLTGSVDNGMSSTSLSLSNNGMGEITLDQYGITAKMYDDVTGTYGRKQFRIANNVLEFTENGWETSNLGIGNVVINKYNSETGQVEEQEGYGIATKYVNNGIVNNTQIYGGDMYSSNYDPNSNTGSHIDLEAGKITLDGVDIDVFKGATETSDGTRGFVPAPTIADRNKVLRGDGTWGAGSGNANIIELTQEEYDALPDTKESDDTAYFIKDGEGGGGGSGDANIRALTQEEYDALPYDELMDENTLYLVTDSGGGGGSGDITITPIYQDGTLIASYEINGVSGEIYTPIVPIIQANPTSTATEVLSSININDTIYSLGTSTVVANPSDIPTDTLSSIKINETVYSIEGGSGSEVIINPTLSSGTKIADYSINGISGSLYAPSSSSGGIADVLVDGTSVVSNNIASINLTNYATKTEIGGKQDTLIAGSNIQIASDGKTISATNTTYTAGDNITITNNIISATDTTYSDMIGATSATNGSHGLVPTPLIADKDKFLKGDGTWDTPSGGTSIVPNPSEEATNTLNKIKIDNTVFEILGNNSVLYGTTIPTSQQGTDGSLYVQYNATSNTIKYVYCKINGLWMLFPFDYSGDAFVDDEGNSIVTDDGEDIIFIE